uniref:Uncharacterized protein n=1 Tax=Romanomermis culicivorax TaxID=13658 RepID=A0A915J8I7_ROMCU
MERLSKLCLKTIIGSNLWCDPKHMDVVRQNLHMLNVNDVMDPNFWISVQTDEPSTSLAYYFDLNLINDQNMPKCNTRAKSYKLKFKNMDTCPNIL